MILARGHLITMSGKRREALFVQWDNYEEAEEWMNVKYAWVCRSVTSLRIVAENHYFKRTTFLSYYVTRFESQIS